MSVNDPKPGKTNGYSDNGSYGRNYIGDDSGIPSSTQDPDEIDLKRLFYTLWHNKWIIVGSVLLFSMLAGIFAYSTTPIYRSEGSMLIKDSGSNLSMDSDEGLASLLSSTYGIGMGSTIANELQILRSRNLSYEMADSLMKQRLMDNGRQFPVLFVGYPDDSTLASRDTVALRLRESFSFSRADREADLVNISYESPSPLEAAFAVNLSMQLYTNLSTRQNRLAANAAVEFLKNERSRIEERLNTVEQRLREFMNREQLVQIDAQTQKLIEQMAELESRRQEAGVKLVAVNSAISQYEERLNSIKPGLAGQYADAIGPNMARLQYQLAELEIEKMQLLANNPGLKNQENATGKLTELNDKIAFYRERIRELTGNLIEQSDQYLGFLGRADGNVAETITQLNQKLIELKVEQQQYRSQVEVLDEQLAEQNRFFENLPDNMIELARLRRDVTINEELFLTVSKQFAEMSLWEQTQFGLGRPVDDGFIPENPVKPDKKIYVLVGFILGGILGVGFIFLREAFNDSIDAVEKLNRFKLPVLSVIPEMSGFIEKKYNGRDRVAYSDMKVKTNLVTMLDSLSPISESYRRLQSNILYTNPDRALDTIMITSSKKGEGKTTTVSNLGVIMAESGYKTLLLDADLRRPNLHNTMGLERLPGLMDHLFEEVELSDAIRETPVHNLHILPSGKEIPNPPAVMQSNRFLDLLRKLEQEYDMVLIDSSPFGIITDVSALIKEVDALVVVTRFAETTESELHHTLKNLRHLNAHVLGTVLTAFNPEKSSDYSYTNSYYRHAYRDYTSYHSK